MIYDFRNHTNLNIKAVNMTIYDIEADKGTTFGNKMWMEIQ